MSGFRTVLSYILASMSGACFVAGITVLAGGSKNV